MNKSSAKEVERPSAQQINDLIVDSIQDIKGKNIIKIDLRELDESPSDFFIVCEGESNTQIKAIAENVVYRLKKETNTYPVNKEGIEGTQWILVDYFDVVLHVFHPEARAFYELEDLWSDANFTEYQNI